MKPQVPRVLVELLLEVSSRELPINADNGKPDLAVYFARKLRVPAVEVLPALQLLAGAGVLSVQAEQQRIVAIKKGPRYVSKLPPPRKPTPEVPAPPSPAPPSPPTPEPVHAVGPATVKRPRVRPRAAKPIAPAPSRTRSAPRPAQPAIVFSTARKRNMMRGHEAYRVATLNRDKSEPHLPYGLQDVMRLGLMAAAAADCPDQIMAVNFQLGLAHEVDLTPKIINTALHRVETVLHHNPYARKRFVTALRLLERRRQPYYLPPEWEIAIGEDTEK